MKENKNIGYKDIPKKKNTKKSCLLLVPTDTSLTELKSIIKQSALEIPDVSVPDNEMEAFVEAVLILLTPASSTPFHGPLVLDEIMSVEMTDRILYFVEHMIGSCFQNEDFFTMRRTWLKSLQQKYPKGVEYLYELDSYSPKTKNLFYFVLNNVKQVSEMTRVEFRECLGEENMVDAAVLKNISENAIARIERHLIDYLSQAAESESISDTDDTTPNSGYPDNSDNPHALQQFLENWTPFKLAEYIKKYIAGQDKGVEIFSQMCYEHVVRIANPDAKIRKSNYVMFGPTGCGKTEMAKIAQTVVPVPIAIIDSSSITSQGFKGLDKEDVMASLVQRYMYDAVNAIIILDEFDKLCYTRSASRGDDVNKSIQFDLLKMVEGTTLLLKVEEMNFPLDTHDITFVCAGAFDGAFTPNIKKAFGFGSSDTDLNDEKSVIQCLIDFGMVPEFAGRISTLIPMKQLDRTDLYNILTKTENNCIDSIINLYKYAYHTELTFTKSALNAICDIAYESQLGARSLQSIVETVCHSNMTEKLFTELSKSEKPTMQITEALVNQAYNLNNRNKKQFSRG